MCAFDTHIKDYLLYLQHCCCCFCYRCIDKLSIQAEAPLNTRHTMGGGAKKVSYY